MFAIVTFHVHSLFFSCTPTATTELYTLSLHDALPISSHAPRVEPEPLTSCARSARRRRGSDRVLWIRRRRADRDRKSTRLNSSHVAISYAVFCLKKKRKKSTAKRLTPTTHQGSTKM